MKRHREAVLGVAGAMPLHANHGIPQPGAAAFARAVYDHPRQVIDELQAVGQAVVDFQQRSLGLPGPGLVARGDDRGVDFPVPGVQRAGVVRDHRRPALGAQLGEKSRVNQARQEGEEEVFPKFHGDQRGARKCQAANPQLPRSKPKEGARKADIGIFGW